MGTGKNWKIVLSSISKRLFNDIVLRYILLYLVFIAYFAFYRFALLLLNINEFKDVPFATILSSFLVGARFDTSVSLYALSLFFLVNSLFYFFDRVHWLRVFNLIYLTLIAFCFVFLSFVEIEFYRYFHNRLNIYCLNVENNTKFVAKLIWESYPVVPYLVLIALITTVLFFLFKKILKLNFTKSNVPLHYKVLSFLIFAVISFVGIRGTLSQKTPLRWGHAFFSTYNQCNKLALNGIFTLVDDILKTNARAEDLSNILPYGSKCDTATISKIVCDSSSKYLNFPLRVYESKSSVRKYNVVLFLLESFSMKKIQEYTAMGIPLFINELKRDGVFFENIYSNGIHTYMGVFSSLFGMPNIIGKSIMVQSIGQQSFHGLPNILKENGYVCYFAVSHDANFDNMAGFLRGNGVDEVVSQFDFPSNLVLSSLGIPDHILFEKMNEVFSKSQEPFFGIILSTNNHGPWIVPKVEGKSFVSTFDYTDWALRHFFELAKKERYFHNTIFVVTADHGIAENSRYDLPLEGVHVPLVFYAPNILKPGVRKVIGSHIDVPNTVLSLLSIPFYTTNYGRNLFDYDSSIDKGFAVFHEGQTLGIIFDDWYLIDRLKSNCSLYKYKSKDPTFDYSNQYPDTVEFLRRILEGIYYRGNKMLLEQFTKPKSQP